MKTKILFLLLCALQICKVYAQTVTCTAPFITSDWSCTGPFEYPADVQMGRVVSIWVDPENTDHILAGTRASSLWETTNGGDNWQNILSYDFPATGVWSIAAYKDGTGYNYYLSTMFDGSDRNIHSLGMIYYDHTDDEWIRVGDFPNYTGTLYDFKLEGSIDNELHNRKFFVRPGTSELWIGNSRNFFRWNMSSNTWIDDEYPDSYPVVNLDEDGDASAELHQVNEIDFAPWDNTMAIMSPASAEADDLLFTSNADGADPDWTAMYVPYTGLFTLDEPAGDKYRMTCTTSIPGYSDAYVFANYLIIRSDGSTEQYNRLFKYLLPVPGGSAYPTLVNYWDVTNDFITLAHYDLAENLLVFPDHPEQFIIGNNTTALYKGVIPTTGSSITMGYVSVTNGNDATLTHTDIRDIAFIDKGIGESDLLFIATDGGISKTSDVYGLTLNDYNNTISKWQNINGYGLAITEFNGFNNSEREEHETWAAAPDGNSFIHSNLLTDDEAFFSNYPGGDGYDVAISNTYIPTKGVFNSNSGGTKGPSDFSGFDIDNLTTTPGDPKVPKSRQSTCTDCDICPWNCLESNFSLKPFNFENDLDGEYLWTGTSDLFRNADPFTTPTADDWVAMSKTYITLADPDVDDLANLDVITYNPITAYEKIDNYPFVNFTTMYYATKEVKDDYVYTNPSDDVDVYEEIKLVKATYDPSTTPATFLAEDVTPNLDEDVSSGYYNQIDHSFITGMAIDKTNPQELWVCFGSNTLGGLNRILDYTLGDDHDAKNGRVYYSPDGGTTWYNRSAGLPDYPIITLCYWEGSDDIIFAGTDVGVYVWNKTENEWECFDTGDKMPYASVNDLEINYCTMSLRASTFGFGIWETPLPALTSSQQKPIIINTDVSWTQDMDAKTDIIIEYPGSLTIQDCEIRMPENGKITVQKGGWLKIDNATITNHCSFWQGIEVEGAGDALEHPVYGSVLAGDYPSLSTQHGAVVITNESFINNSQKGVYTLNNKRGGIILASNSTFLNNKTAVDMKPYDYLVGGAANTDDDNISRFTNCTFQIDDKYFGNNDFEKQVNLNDVDGVTFEGSVFKNEMASTVTGINRGEGIFSTNATYTVAPGGCTVSTSPCPDEYLLKAKFEGFFRGIEASNTATLPLDIIVDRSVFTNNYRGILLSSVKRSEITSNIFEIPDNSTEYCYGLYLEGSKGYHVENNTFSWISGSYISGTPYFAGIYVANNGSASTKIYKNYFQNIEVGVRCQSENSGLQIKCNEFYAPVYNFNIYITSGQLANQGQCLTTGSASAKSKAPAGNTFTACTTPPSAFIKNIKNGSGLGFTYSYHNSPADKNPFSCSAGTITDDPCSIGFDYNGHESCPSTLTGGSGEKLMADETEVDTTGAAFLENAEELQTEIEYQAAKIDGGDTEEIISDIENGAYSQTTLYETLNEVSPYLSNEVIVSVIEKPDAISTYDLLDILDKNSPIDEGVANALAVSDYEIPSTVQEALTDTITILSDGTIQIEKSEMDILEEYIEEVHAEKLENLETAINLYLQEGNIDSAIISAESDSADANWNNQRKTEIYYNAGDYETASGYLDSIITSNEELTDYKELYNILIDVAEENRSIDSLTEDEISTLTTIGGKHTPSGIAALNVLKVANDELHEELFEEEIEDEEGYKLNAYATFANSSFMLYPNPAEEIVYVQVNEVNMNCCNHLYIYDITGKTIYSEKLEQGFIVTWINTSNFNKGIYFVQLVSDDAETDAQKLVIE